LQFLEQKRTHRFRLMAQSPRVASSGGTIHVASAREYPISTTFTAVITKLKPGSVHAPHWHANANEWHYVARGRTRVTLFASDKRLATAELSWATAPISRVDVGIQRRTSGRRLARSSASSTVAPIRRLCSRTG